ncbi:MAG: diguanylate cyclase [Candidatus Omnitrophica bacterium]|nr:diguanylate cyclase [Candidatus Omnitrophota bacterium]
MIEFEETGNFKKPTYIAREKELNLAHPESQHMFRRLVERGHISIFIADIKGYLFYVNHAFVGMLGFETKDDILGTNLADMIFQDSGKRAEFLRKINKTGFVRDYRVEMIRSDHVSVILSVTSNLVENDKGVVIGIEGIVHNVTRRNQLEEDLMTEKKKLEQLLEFDEAVSPIKDFDELAECVVERTAKILEVMKCSLMVLGDETGTLSIAVARGLSDEVVKEAKVKLGEMIAGVVAKDGQPLLVRNIEYDRKFQRANRPTYLGRSFMIAPITLGEKVVGVINVSDKILKKGMNSNVPPNYEQAFGDVDLKILCSISREVSTAFENIQLYEQLNSLAVTDPLTHIYNYRQFSKSLDYEIKRCQRKNIPLCVIMIDIDDFKSYNDAFGHPEGNSLLKNLGRIFRDQLREVDIVCRYAGDEFAVILPDTDIEGAERAAQKVQNAVGRFSFRKKVTLSIGAAGYVDGITQYRLIQNADKALYQAKRDGKNRICVSQ